MISTPRVFPREQLGCAAEYGKMAMQMPWPEYDESKTVAAHTEMAVQVNGKMRGTVLMAADLSNEEVVANAVADEKISKFLEKIGGNIVKTLQFPPAQNNLSISYDSGKTWTSIGDADYFYGSVTEEGDIVFTYCLPSEL